MRRKLTPGESIVPPKAAPEPAPDLPDFLTPSFYERLCNGNKSAAAFCKTYIEDCHTTDDIVDGDKDLTDERLVAVRLDMTLKLSGNEFWQEHWRSLFPIFVGACAAYLDANRFSRGLIAKYAKPDEALLYRRAAEVLKSQYGEVLWHVAFICGGWTHMRDLQKEYRVFGFDFRE